LLIEFLLGIDGKVSGVKEIQPSLTDALNAYYESATVKPQAFRLEPIKEICILSQQRM
jgi:hypothetical protein